MKQPARQLGPWRIERTLGRDLCGQYHAVRRDDGVCATLYLLSGQPVAGGIESLHRLVAQHRELSDLGVVGFRELVQDGNDLYLIADPVDEALTSLRCTRRPNSGQIASFGAALACALAVAHDRGLVHGGLELDHVVWAPGRAPRILGTGVAALGMTDRVALADGDVAALGRLLCALIIGQQPPGGRPVLLDAAIDRRIVETVRLLADPSAALSMREAHAMLADGASLHPAADPDSAAGATSRPDPPWWRTDDQDTHADLDLGPASRTALDEPIADQRGGAAPAGWCGSHLARYRILTRLGRGGMGEVFLAEDPALRRGVAIKRIRPGFERDRVFRARLRREAQLAARLSHRAIVQVFDLVVDDDADHLVMEYVPGPSLHALFSGGPLASSDVVRIAIEVVDGLACAHERGIIHRDLKLENILIGLDLQPKITDFGVARGAAITSDAGRDESLTHGRFIVGTLRAMSPEQLQSRDIDARSDLFSLGVLLYELATGTSPFAADSDVQTILHVLHHRQRPASELSPDVPGALSDLIDQLLEKTAARRPDSARSVLDRLRSLDLAAPSTDERRSVGPARTARDTAVERQTGEPTVAHSVRPVTPRPITGPLSRARSPDLSASVGGERRQVTLLCIELVAGGTHDAASDPELLAGVLAAFRAQVNDILARSDGLVISAMGHRIVACFGHPRPLEDAARRAVLAGRAMLDAAAELRSLDPVHTGVRFVASGAIHTGLAIDCSRGGDELVLGTTLDTALRLLQLGAGHLWLSGTTARLVETDFRLELAVATTEGGTSAHRLIGVLVPAQQSSGQYDRPMVARDHEMQLLLDSWRHARQGRGQVALLVGEPGIGKSRLVRELAAAIAVDRPRQIVLRGSAHRQRSALEPVADAIAALLSLPDAGGGATADRIRAFTSPGEAEQVLHFLGRSATPPTGAPERARHQLLSGLRDVLVGAHDAPTLIVVEDLHWLDPSTLDLIALIIRSVAPWPVFLVMTARPGVSPPWPAAAAITQLRLGRLAPPAIDALISHAAAGRALSVGERAVIAARAEGVPLFAEELVRAALELGRAGEIPSTLRDALTARLHQLGPTAISVAHVAAVAGREFTAELIATAGGLDPRTVERELDRLVAAEILSRRHGRTRELHYQFSHVLLQQAAYDELLAADRRHLHGQIADALMANECAGCDPGTELIAHHLAGARRFDEAVASTHRAALRALGRHARVEARELLRQALSWLDQLPESETRDRTELGLRMELSAALLTTEGYTSPELERSCRRTEALCARHEDMPFPVKCAVWTVRFMRGSADESRQRLGWLSQVIDHGGPPIERMMAHALTAIYHYVRASYVEAGDHFERSIALFAPAEHAGVVQLYGGCGGFYSHVVTTILLWRVGRFIDAWRHARATVALAETLDPYALCCALTFEMMLHIAVGDTARTEASAERIHDIAARYELRYLTCWALCGRGWALARRGRADRAMLDLSLGAEVIQQIGVKVWFPYYLSLLAESAIALGRFDCAERAVDQALELSRSSVDQCHEPELLRLRGQLILARDESAREPARAAFAEALAVAQRHGGRALALRAATDLAALFRDDHLPDRAIAVLGPLYRGFAPELDDPNLASARQLLAELSVP